MRRGHIPMRMCVICRIRASKASLTRHTAEKNRLVPNISSDCGRGFYVCKNPACMERILRYRPKKRSD